MRPKGLVVLLLLVPLLAPAGQVAIRFAEFVKQGHAWSVNVTLQHADSGWDHYADGWRIVTADGRELGRRTLYHPHVNEQPFTRSLGGVIIPDTVQTVYVEAHDKVHGWSPQRLKVDLEQAQGARYRVRR
ncbi:MAG TPA: hypothetical protein EYP40_03090 [Chromatiales bacterium]|nr:hypothetical protein [Chromatiales bacterium]